MRTLLFIGVASLTLATCWYLASLWSKTKRLLVQAHWVYRASLGYWAVAFVTGALKYNLCSGTRPWLIASAWLLGVIYLLLLRRYPIDALGSFIAAISTVLASFTLFDGHVERPILTNTWSASVLWTHIGLAFIGLTAFAFASAVSVLYLIEARMLKLKRHNTLKRRLPPLDILDRLAFKSILAGFPFYTVALLLGSMRAFGNGSGSVKLAYIFAFVSWVIYGIVLQARLTAGWQGRRAAMLTLLGFCLALLVVGSYSSGGR